MKLTAVLILTSLLSAACQRVPESIRQPLDEARQRLAAVTPGMSRKAAETVAGPAAVTGRRAVWEEKRGEVNFERLTVHLDRAARVDGAEWVSSRGNQSGLYRWLHEQRWKASPGQPRWYWKRLKRWHVGGADDGMSPDRTIRSPAVGGA